MKSFTQSDGFKNLTRIVTTLYAILFLVNVFVKGSALTWASAILLLIIYFLGFCIMNKTNRLVIGILAILGAVLLVVYKVDVNGWLAAIRKSASTIALIYFASILSMPFFYKPYQAELKNVCEKYIPSVTAFLILSGIVAFFLGFYMSMAAIPVVYALLGDISKEYKCHRAFLMTICAGNALIIAAAPSTGAGVALPAYNLTYMEMFRVGFPLTILLTVVAAVVNAATAKKEGAVNREKNPNIEVKWSSIGMLVFIFLLLTAIILGIDKYTNINVLAGVCLLAVPFALVFAVAQGKMDVFKKRLSGYWDKGMLKNPNMMTILGVGGFVGEGLKRVGAINAFFEFLASQSSLALVLPLLIMLIAVLTSIVGVHPAAMGATLAAIVKPELLGVTPVCAAMIVLLGWSISLAASPFSAVTNLTSAQSGEDIFTFTAGKSAKWVAVTLIVATVLIDLLVVLGI